MSDPVVKNDATKAIREANPALKLNRMINCGNGHSINGIGDVPVPILQKGIFVPNVGYDWIVSSQENCIVLIPVTAGYHKELGVIVRYRYRLV